MSLWRGGDTRRSERSKAGDAIFTLQLRKGPGSNAFCTGTIYGSAFLVKRQYFEYVGCELDHLNGRYSNWQAAVIDSSMHGNAYFQ